MFDKLMFVGKHSSTWALVARAVFCTLALSFTIIAQGKNPVILIPGISGSELRHKDTNERVWFRAFRTKAEDLRLPVPADVTKSHDDLVPGDVLREVKIGAFPVTDVYGDFIHAMQIRGGYHEESWDSPSDEGYQDSLYVFPYDWRLDNVQNARLLVRKIEALKRRLKKSDLKFDVVAHSMGGIICRYAAMYGDADLPAGDLKPIPNWVGAKLFDKIILMGTPNEGSAMALNDLVEGFSVRGIRIDLPLVQDMSKFTLFTMPSGYQLLPAPGTLRAFDDKLQPISIDLFDPKVWTKFGWNVIDDKEFVSTFGADDRKNASVFFASALIRAKRLHEALAASDGIPAEPEFYVIGAECKDALDAIVVYKDERSGKWKTLFRPKSFRRSDGELVSEETLKKVMFMPGDGVVTQRSLEAATESEKGERYRKVTDRSGEYVCEEHFRLAANARIQDHIIAILDGKRKLKESPDKKQATDN